MKYIDTNSKNIKTTVNIPSDVVNFIMDHYGLFDIVEANQISFFVLNCLAKIEKDGFQIGMFKNKVDENGKKQVSEAFTLNIHDLIAQFRVEMSKQFGKEKDTGNKV